MADHRPNPQLCPTCESDDPNVCQRRILAGVSRPRHDWSPDGYCCRDPFHTTPQVGDKRVAVSLDLAEDWRWSDEWIIGPRDSIEAGPDVLGASVRVVRADEAERRIEQLERALAEVART